MIYARMIKRAADVALSLVVIAVTSPLLIVSAACIKLTSPGPVLFLQQRVGRNGESFSIFKLRTMTQNNDSLGRQTRQGDPDVTFVGNWLRRLKIDELPQVFNVLNGDMSLVGPRPCLSLTYEAMPQWARRRFDVRPGMTGLAQINGNVALSWEERWRFDVEYVERLSLMLDLSILLKTVLVVLLGEERYRSRG